MKFFLRYALQLDADRFTLFLEENVRRVVVDEAFIIIPFARNFANYMYSCINMILSF